MKSVILLGPIDGQFTDYVPLKCPITIRFFYLGKLSGRSPVVSDKNWEQTRKCTSIFQLNVG